MKLTINDAGELLCKSLENDLKKNKYAWSQFEKTQIEALIKYIDDVTGEYHHRTLLDNGTCDGLYVINTVFKPAFEIIRHAKIGMRSDYISVCLAYPTESHQAEALYMHAKRLKDPEVKRLKKKYKEAMETQPPEKEENMKDLKRYAVPITAKEVFSWYRFTEDWERDGGEWRLIITPPMDGTRRGLLYTIHDKEALRRAGVHVLNSTTIELFGEKAPFSIYGCGERYVRLLAEFTGSRREILRQAKEKIAEVEEALERKKYVLVYGDF